MDLAIIKRISAGKKNIACRHQWEKAGFITGIDLLIDGGTIATIQSRQMVINIQ